MRSARETGSSRHVLARQSKAVEDLYEMGLSEVILDLLVPEVSASQDSYSASDRVYLRTSIYLLGS